MVSAASFLISRMTWQRVDSLLVVKRRSDLNSCHLLEGERGCRKGGEGVGFGAVEGLLVFEHAEDGVQEFAHGGDQGLEFGFTAPQQVVVESAQVGLTTNGHQGGHVEGAAQVSVAGLGDARLLLDRRTRGVLAGIEAGVGDPLTAGRCRPNI